MHQPAGRHRSRAPGCDCVPRTHDVLYFKQTVAPAGQPPRHRINTAADCRTNSRPDSPPRHSRLVSGSIPSVRAKAAICGRFAVTSCNKMAAQHGQADVYTVAKPLTASALARQRIFLNTLLPCEMEIFARAVAFQPHKRATTYRSAKPCNAVSCGLRAAAATSNPRLKNRARWYGACRGEQHLRSASMRFPRSTAKRLATAPAPQAGKAATQGLILVSRVPIFMSRWLPRSTGVTAGLGPGHGLVTPMHPGKAVRDARLSACNSTSRCCNYGQLKRRFHGRRMRLLLIDRCASRRKRVSAIGLASTLSGVAERIAAASHAMRLPIRLRSISPSIRSES